MRIPEVTETGMAAVDLSQVNLFDADFHAVQDPHTVWAVMRERAPLHRQELPDGRSFWSVTRYHDACRVLGNHREFTSERGSLLNQLGHAEAASGKMLVATDPPRHGELRRPLNKLFTGRGLVRSEDRIREAVRTLLAPSLDGGEWDLAQRATMLPMAVAGTLMDLPEPDWDDLVQWTGMAAAPDDPVFMIRNAHATLAIAHHQLFKYFSEQYEARKGAEGDDAIGVLMTMRDGELTPEEVVVNCYSLLLGANATTPHTVAGTVLALLERPEQFRAVRENPALVPALVEEGLRWTSPASSFLRYAVEDVELSGGVVPRGDAVAVWVGSANRDADVFADPYRFDVTRQENRHIAFGYGAHYCLGATVARITLRIFFEEVLRSTEDITLAGEPRHLASNFVAGLTSLPVRATPRRPGAAFGGRTETALSA
ncbi:cytochrome P450 [Streptomyces sp. NPDC054766]|uniref:cytochrome P450 n=1 Tax=Streptomyces rhizosphaerihabitans TaxID=1266770 RepID=UPI0021BECC52|nr:cytochrome P450 [Streptomyces rhizosphaerihabitans]MCT9004765.1 cytochrome P450 [Streptomyces rhizosphaerihabitans]